MSKQKRRNISLLILAAFLVVMISLMSRWSSSPSDNLDTDRSQFTLENTIDINKVVARSNGEITELSFTGGKWLLDGTEQADPTKVHLLFATIQQVKVRRPAGQEVSSRLSEEFAKQGTEVSFFENDQQVLQLETLGMDQSGQTWFRNDNGEIFLMEIPGYRVFIHPLLTVEGNTWRNHNLFHKLNWRNLSGLSVEYPGNSQNDFRVIQRNQNFTLESIANPDTTRLFDYVDYVSLVEADRYLNTEEIPSNFSVELKLDVRDVGNRPYILEILDVSTEDSYRIGRMDSSVYFALSEDRVAPLFAKPEDFRK